MSILDLREPSRAAARPPASASRPALRFRGTRHAEICVVGAGYAGLSTALHLAERGYDTVVLEAAEIGAGASGRNGGQVLPGFAAEPAAMIAALGEARARELWNLSLRGVAKVRALAGKECDVRPGVATIAASPDHLRDVADHVRVRREIFGETGIELLDRTALARALPGAKGHGGAIDQRAFSLDPVKYVAALAARALAAGAAIHENSPAIGLARETRGWTVRAPGGEIRADRVVLATNVDLAGLDPEARRLAAPVRTFMLETAPIASWPEWLAGAAFDTSTMLRYFRLTADGRVRFGAGGWPGRGHPPLVTRWLRRALGRALPPLARVKVERAWSGLVDATTDGMPRFGEREGLVRLLGFCGHGVALATLAGLLVADTIDGDGAEFRRLTDLDQRRTWPTAWGQAAQILLGRVANA